MGLSKLMSGIKVKLNEEFAKYTGWVMEMNESRS